MFILKWLSLCFVLALMASCFYPWVSVESKNIVVTGFSAEQIHFGKPGYLHVFLSGLFILFVLLHKIWSLRAAFFISAFNVAWGVRNFIALSACSGGECPVKHAALYVVLLAPVAATVSMLFLPSPPATNRGD